MNRLFLGLVALLAIQVAPLAALAAPPPNISQTVGVCDPSYPTRCVKPNADGSVNVSGSISATSAATATAAAPAYVEGTPSPLSQDLSGHLRVTGPVTGTTTSGSSLTASPVTVGCRAATAVPTAVTDGQVVNLQCGTGGALVVRPYSISESLVSGTTAAMTGTSSTVLLAAPASGVRNYLTQIACVNSHASVGTFITVQDGSGGTALMTLAAASVFGGETVTLPAPLRQPATATGLYVADVTTGANVICSATGYTAP